MDAKATDGPEQARLLEEAFGFVAEQRFYLRKAVQKNDLEMTLRQAFCLANELRTSRLVPENYYKLYALVFWELQHVAAFIAAVDRHGKPLPEVYELVQYEGNVLPRLYMLVTVGAVFIQSGEGPAQEIITDLGKMLDAVQHPVRGLFLRYYMLQMTKDKLIPVCGAREALKILMANLRECTSLWVRLRLDEPGSTRGSREGLHSLRVQPLQPSALVGGGPQGGGSLQAGQGSPTVPPPVAGIRRVVDVGGELEAGETHARSATPHDGVPPPLQFATDVDPAQLVLPADHPHIPSQYMQRQPRDAKQNHLQSGVAVSVGGTPFGSPVGATDFTYHIGRSRQMLHMLVGAHMMHMVQMRLLTAELHAEVVLPEVLRIGPLEDPAGQAYLLECFVEVFPDSYHLHTLDQVLSVCAQLQWVVDLRQILQGLMQRLTAFLRTVRAAAASGVEDANAIADILPGASFASILKVDVFAAFHAHLTQLHARPRSVATPLSSLLELQLELLMTAIMLHPGETERIEQVLRGTADLVAQRDPGEELDTVSGRAILNILAAPLTSAQVAAAVLAAPHHEKLVGALTRSDWQYAALAMVRAALAGDVALSDVETLRRFLNLLYPLIHDDCTASATSSVHAARGSLVEGEGAPAVAPRAAASSSGAGPGEQDRAEFAAEQEVVAQLVHQVRHANPAVCFEMLKVVRSYFQEGGPHRVTRTLPAVLIATLRLVKPLVLERQRNQDSKTSVRAAELFSFVQSLLEKGLPVLQAEERLRLWLLSSSVAERAIRALAGSESKEVEDLTAACEYAFKGALCCLDASGCQVAAPQLASLHMLVGTLQQIACLSEDTYREVAGRVVKIAERFPTRRLQSKAVGICVHLYWGSAQRDAWRALSCLQAALRLSDGALHVDPESIELFVELLDQAVHLFEKGNNEVTPTFLSGLLALCVQHIRYLGGREPPEVKRALATTLILLQARAADDRYAKINLVSPPGWDLAAVVSSA